MKKTWKFLFSAFISIHCIMTSFVMSNDIATDTSVLISLRDQVTSEPHNILARNWSYATPVCSWIGVTCGLSHRRVTALNISNMELTGRIPPQVGNLSFLVSLDMSENNFNGSLPRELRNLHGIQELFLQDNQLSGSFPDEIGYLINLKSLSMDDNMITGSFPVNLLNASSLKFLSFRNNHLTGHIPREIGNLTMLTSLYLSNNSFTGGIPEEMGYLNKLEYFYLLRNILSGPIPPSIFNISSLIDIGFTSNNLSGSLPRDIGNGLPNIKELKININDISGVIPDSISNASQLTILTLRLNRFTGSVPNSLGNLRNIEFLSIARNNLTSESLEMSFINSLTNCKNLKYLIINTNPLNGFLPASISNLSVSLENIYASNCGIRGIIPEEIGILTSLTLLDLSENDLTGVLPSSIRRLQNLQRASFSVNRIGGTISNICSLLNLGLLQMSHTEISGSIPDCLGNITLFRDINLDSNRLNSTVPPSLWNLKDLLNLNLSSNSLTGFIPEEIKNLEAIVSIDISFNQFTGDIPNTVGSMVHLVNLSLAGNTFQGPIPESLGNLISLESLDISNNSFSGMIPKSLQNMQRLKVFNVSFNRLSGEIPNNGPFENFTYESFMSNDAFCGTPRFHVPPCHDASRRKQLLPLVAIIVLVIASAILVAIFLYIVLVRRKKQAPVNVIPPIATLDRVSYQQLLSATNGFHESNLLGTGSSCSVYKANYENETCVAVKVFNLQLEIAFKNFNIECEVLRNLRHRNLTKVISSCANLEFKALILEYMPNGSLEKWLHTDGLLLNLIQRLNIVIDVACAMEYLHNGYTSPVAHCDLKPSNVLLDEEMVGHVTDFGIAKLLGDATTIHTKTLATLGYIAPEYGIEGFVSTKCDVYSYGIMLMETFTGRCPSDQMFDDDLSLKKWVMDSIPCAFEQVIDSKLLELEKDHLDEKLECISSVMELALNCSLDNPGERMNMKHVVASLTKIKLRVLSLL